MSVCKELFMKLQRYCFSASFSFNIVFCFHCFSQLCGQIFSNLNSKCLFIGFAKHHQFILWSTHWLPNLRLATHHFLRRLQCSSDPGYGRTVESVCDKKHSHQMLASVRKESPLVKCVLTSRVRESIFHDCICLHWVHNWPLTSL